VLVFLIQRLFDATRYQLIIVRLRVFITIRDLNRSVPRNFARVLIVRSAIEVTTPITAPMSRNHATARTPFAKLQVRQSPPVTAGEGCELGGVPGLLPGVPPGVLLAFSTCMGTLCVLVHDGLLLFVTVKSTVNVWPAWLTPGVNEK